MRILALVMIALAIIIVLAFGSKAGLATVLVALAPGVFDGLLNAINTNVAAGGFRRLLIEMMNWPAWTYLLGIAVLAAVTAIGSRRIRG